MVVVFFCHEGAGQVPIGACPDDVLHPCRVSEPLSNPHPTPGPAGVAPGGTQRVIKRFLHTQGDLWTAPRRMKLRDFQWLLPAGGMTASLIVSDSRTAPEFQRLVDQHHAGKFSDLGVGA